MASIPGRALLAHVAWKQVSSTEDDRALGKSQAFVPGPATTALIMVKDSTKYATMGAWGFGRFIDGKAADKLQPEACLSCHEVNGKGNDMAFTHYAP